MQTLAEKNKEKVRRDRAKKAVALAMHSNWDDAAKMNSAILRDFPKDLEAQNRLGKALSELGRNREAREAFKRALEISPHNSIARKNLDRLMRLGDQDVLPQSRDSVEAAPKVFIEESGKATTTSLVRLAPSNNLLKLAPGHRVSLEIENGRARVLNAAGEYVGSVEPRLAARLLRLVRGGNQYEAAVTSAGTSELTIMIRETFKHPSQAGIVSFPSRAGSNYRVYMPGSMLAYDEDASEVGSLGRRMIKDWSDDDTEPGDDEAFAPVIHRIINSSDDDDDEILDDEDY
ncbi:MAG: tetratricopeptide repeat protein [Chloroflexi bacterium]|nr:tetratricopeptide repeat protein [Chloroflexota bacterium]